MKRLIDDLLVEIFIRVPDCRSVIRCGAVCKQWLSVINSIHFRHQKHQHLLLPPFTIIFRHGRADKWSMPVYEYFSNELQILHRMKESESESYLDFLPSSWRDLRLLSSCDDLLLMSRERGKYFFISNPFTRHWLELPVPETIHNLVPFDGQGGLVCKQEHEHHVLRLRYRYKVILIWQTYYNCDTIFSQFFFITFCSETGRWTPEKTLSFDYDLNDIPPLVCNGMLHWLRTDLERSTVHGIVAFDLFKDENHPHFYRFIDFPLGLVQGSLESHQARVRLGLVQGKLRLSQLLVTETMGFVLKVWELNYDDDFSKLSWTTVHNVTMKGWTDIRRSVVAFHPNNGNVLFLLHNRRYLYHYDIGEEKLEQIFKFPKSVDYKYFPTYIFNFTLVHPFWPTSIPALPSL